MNDRTKEILEKIKAFEEAGLPPAKEVETKIAEEEPVEKKKSKKK